MPIRTYHEFELLAEAPTFDATGLRGLTVRVIASPAGELPTVPVALDAPVAGQLTAALDGLERRMLDPTSVIGLGEALADLLFPTDVRALLVTSLAVLGRDEGLRIRLRLDPELAELPWEFAWVEHQRGQRDATGFLALDPRISLVRHETVAGTVEVDPAPRDRRVVAALANPVVGDEPPLNLDAERLNLENALAGVPGISVDFVTDATIQALSEALLDGADVFHFAGHGFQDELVLVDRDHAPSTVGAAQLAVNLRGRGVQVAVLGACESAARSRRDRWSGVATKLIAERIPAVVAMQYRIGDSTAITFGDHLYRALAAGLSLDEAVSVGRLAIYNATTSGPDALKRARLWRDWGVPVLYLRPDVTLSLASVKDPKERERLAADLDVDVRVRVKDVRKGGKVVGTEAGVITSGKLRVSVTAGEVSGEVTGLKVDRVGGGATTVDVDAGDVVDGGTVTGATIGSIGGTPGRRRGSGR
jgi:hypothetical protein